MDIAMPPSCTTRAAGSSGMTSWRFRAADGHDEGHARHPHGGESP
jgi:hypothetical protein